MIAIILLLLICLGATIVGRKCLLILKIEMPSRALAFVYSCSIGLGIYAYSVLAIGLLGHLTPVAVASILLLATLLSWRGAAAWILDFKRPNVVANDNPAPMWLTRFALIIFAILGAAALINCFVPPAGHEWDALAYHLAAPNAYIAEHRILYLPTDHHSNFPFLTEMLFTIGLLFNGHALANLFHFTAGILLIGATIILGKRFFSPAAGWIAALVIATSPIIIWEAGAAYIELNMGLHILLSLGAVLEYRREKESRWLLLAGVMMGFALGSKALALVPFVALGFMLLREGTRFKQLRWYLIGAILIGCPFYIKSAVYTGNPVYPFAYRLLGGKYWNTDLADAYAGSQKAFGLHQNLISASEDMDNKRPAEDAPTIPQKLRNGIAAPFQLITIPRIFYDYYDTGFLNHIGFLWMALPPILWLLPRRPRRLTSDPMAFTGGVAALWFIVWACTMQYVRYLIPLLPLCGLLGGEALSRLVKQMKWLSLPSAAAIGLQSLIAILIFVPDVPEQAARAFDKEAQEKYVRRFVNIYEPCEWINNHSNPSDGVVFFEEARGYYLNRPYLWGNALHSLYIPYPQMANGREMADWFLSHNVRFVLLNMRFAPAGSASPQGQEELRAAVSSGAIAELFLKWYSPQLDQGERWRKLIGEAVYSGAATFVNDASTRGVVVLEFRKKQP